MTQTQPIVTRNDEGESLKTILYRIEQRLERIEQMLTVEIAIKPEARKTSDIINKREPKSNRGQTLVALMKFFNERRGRYIPTMEIKEHLTQTLPSPSSDAALYYNLTKLKEKGLVKNVGFNVWQAT